MTKVLGLEDNKSKEVLDLAALHVADFSFSQTPPTNATPLYEDIAKLLHKEDLYAKIKEESIQKAQKLEPKCLAFLAQSEDSFLTATKIAVVGNVIDLASEVMYDLDDEVDKVMQTDFAIDDTSQLKKTLSKSKKVVYLADNAGENVFDAIYIDHLKKLLQEIEVYYFVRGKPIINDLTLNDLENDRLHQLTTVVDSGVSTPGIIYEQMQSEAQQLFDSADCIISKGMGNYECLSEKSNYPIFFLLKIKCNVVSRALNRPLGAIICKKS